MRYSHRDVVFCVFASVLVGVGALPTLNAQCVSADPQMHRPAFIQAMSSPFVFRPLDKTIHPVKGTDGLIHLSYAVQVTNTTTETGLNFRVVPVDPDKNFNVTGHNFVETDEGKNITGLIKRFGVSATTAPEDELEPDDVPLSNEQYVSGLLKGESGLMLFDLTYTSLTDVPSHLAHKLTVDLNEHGILHHTAITVPVPIDCAPAVVLQSPLAGSGWFDVNGCCAIINGHRSAILHVNGGLFPSEQFAVDWVRIDEKGECCNGDPLKLESWKYFGVPIYAAASGTVVRVLARDLPDQPPLHPTGVTLETLAGNGIAEDIGGGRFILYAHFKQGSLPSSIVEGSHITAGQEIGLLGNSGNSGAPHLHFQVMDAPSDLVANGLPFVLDSLNVEGRIIGLEGPVVDEYLQGKPVHLDTSDNGPQWDRMPISSTVYGFNKR